MKIANLAAFVILSSPTALAMERVSWDSLELERWNGDRKTKLYSLEAARQLFNGIEVESCRFQADDLSRENPPGGAAESLRLSWSAPQGNGSRKMSIGLTLRYLADQTFSRTIAPVAQVEGAPVRAVRYAGDYGFFGRDRFVVTALVDESDQVRHVTGVREDLGYECAGINLGAICIGIGGTVPTGAPDEVLFDCGQAAELLP